MESIPAGKPAVFISYSSVDRDEAFAIRRLLEEHGCSVWLDYFDIKPAESVESELRGNLERADVACLLLSPTAVASRWVGFEIERALAEAGRVRLVPILLRPCKIPDPLSNRVAIDATAGIAQRAVALQIVRGITGTVDKGMLLDAARRQYLAQQARMAEASTKVPGAEAELGRVMELPIRDVTLEVDEDSFPPDRKTIFEVELMLDPMFTAPMSFFVAPFVEEGTWPIEFGFDQPSYREFFAARRPRVDCVFRWYNRALRPAAGTGSYDFLKLPASFTFRFDGEEVLARESGFHVKQRFEVPSIAKLRDRGSRFRVIAHHVDTKTAEEVDLDNSDLAFSVRARFADAEPANIVAFASRRDPDERTVLKCERLASVKSPIWREALLNLIEGPRTEGRAPGWKRSLVDAAEAGSTVADEDRRYAARLAYGEALVARHRGETLRALRLFQGAAVLLEPIVLHGAFTYDEGVLMFAACADLARYYVDNRKFQRAAEFVNTVGVVGQRLVQAAPSEPDYARLWADALAVNSLVHAENGDSERAVAELHESVDVWRRLWQELPSSDRLADAKLSVAHAMERAEAWKVRDRLPFDAWYAELDPEGRIEPAVRAAVRDLQEGPGWLRPADPKDWPARPFESPMLRYALRVPVRFSVEPEVRPLGKETEHVFRGPWPTERLIVSFMEKATGGKMANWVDAVAALTGFPILDLLPAGNEKPPELLEWRYEGAIPSFAERAKLDEAHGYQGLARLQTEPRRIARLYLLLARRGTFAWKVTLTFESACLPGMPEALVYSNDHVRAGAVLGDMRFG
jgi:hypothetical protein